MFTLVIGGAASGKSEYAERHVMALPGERVYIATLPPWDEECLARIEKHRRARAERGFATVERYTDMGAAPLPENANVLLECLGNLTANELYSREGRGPGAALAGVKALLPRCVHLTVVTNEVFSGGDSYEGDTLAYMKDLARANRCLAAAADTVVEVVSGLPNVLKGEPL